jgi:hypothetical protein
MRGFNNLMIIEYRQSYRTIYGNIEALLKRAGDSVRSGSATRWLQSVIAAPTWIPVYNLRFGIKTKPAIRYVGCI